MTELETTISKGSWVLVTGATGFVASHITREFLERGYRVRGTVRDLEKAAWLVEDVFKSYAESGYLELLVVPDLSAPHAFDDAVQGMSAIAIVATIATFDPDPNRVIPQTISGVTSVLEAALNEPKVTEIVFTSSIVAAVTPLPGINTNVERHTWNEEAVKLAWAPPPYNPERGAVVYWASKVQAEQALFKFVEERKPHFNVNSISPPVVIGEPLSKTHTQQVYQWVKTLYDGNVPALLGLPGLIHIDVKDIALLHAAAVLDPRVKGSRIQAWGDYCNWNEILPVMRHLYPERKFIDDIPGLSKLSMTTDLSLSLDLYKKWGNQLGWRSLAETVADNMKKIVEWYP